MRNGENRIFLLCIALSSSRTLKGWRGIWSWCIVAGRLQDVYRGEKRRRIDTTSMWIRWH